MSDAPAHPKVSWANGEAYDRYIGRWSRLVAREFVRWLAVPAGSEWLDVGCGTGTLVKTILETESVKRIRGIDPSEGFIARARATIVDERVSFGTGDAQALPEASESYDAVVAGLVLNFVPKVDVAAGEMLRVAKPGGVVGAYVWDYVGRMELMKHFWNAAVALDPEAAKFQEGTRFSLCAPEPLTALFEHAGLGGVTVRAIEVQMVFRDFDDLWAPFLGGQGPAPAYAMSLSEDKRAALREQIRSQLPFSGDGSIKLAARAWAVRGVRQVG